MNLVDRYNLDPRYYGRTGSAGVVEFHPERCPSGHPLRPDSYLVGSRPCLCSPPRTMHRTWMCRACGQFWTRPACVDCPDWVEWPGRTQLP